MPSAEPPSGPLPITHFRWVVVAVLCAVAFVLYIDRVNLSVAIVWMTREFGLSEQSQGNILSAFLFGYAAGLIPGGWFADRWGAYRVLTAAGLSWAGLTVLMALVPRNLDGSAIAPETTLIGLRFLLGICEACAFPTFSRALACWMRRSERALASGLIHCGAGLGGALTPLLVAAVIQLTGWRSAFLLSGAITFAVALFWWWLKADQPVSHPWVSDEERRLIAAEKEEQHVVPPDLDWYARAARSPEVYLLCLSEVFYGLTGFPFIMYIFKYFVEVRRLDEGISAMASSLNYLAMAIGAPLGGLLCDRCVRRFGGPRGRRIVPVTSITLSGLCSVLAPTLEDTALSAGVFALGCGLLFSAAAAFWSTLIDFTRRGAGIVGGMMNGCGSLGGAVGTLAFPWLLEHLGWTAALQCAGLMGILSGLVWLGIDSTRQIDAPP